MDRAATTPTSGYAWTNHTGNGETRWTFISMEVRAILRFHMFSGDGFRA
ncbi:hypothetical protein NO263_05960 [Gluconacetobacter entanii]|uniref:Transposase n=1 Tax=Gluconacetobacter entanii TaxID=108528 RepID=A0ABT3K407_9PROT|nr:hypothetical protein [Gluconacetobacter entanii]MCW4590124.1 hypothetical protein [Gluconacetobacter entanii]MCW4593273.1 hypothetical protein [Gluconacetobacter entanii]